jgi:pyruvate/2-oxoglutarate dehydrogenase complex dihydrolipoamide dehydrogenase (E3) component
VFGESDGFVKIVADEVTNDILGVHMIGPHVTDMITEAGLAWYCMQLHGKLLIRFIHIQHYRKRLEKLH